MTYIENIKIALMLFPFLAAIFTVPYMIYEYRKFGSIPWWKTTLVFSFIFYLMCAYFMVILPLPVDRTAVVASAAHPQLVPFSFIESMSSGVPLDPTSVDSWLQWLRSPYVYTVLFNVLLTMPFGAFLRYFFHRTWWQTLLMGFGFSLFFEVSQFTGLFGIYAHPYRLFDVDDLIVNTFGAMLGFWLSIPVTHFLPNIDRMNESAIEKGEHHTAFTRRLLAFAIDLILLVVVSNLVNLSLPNTFIGDIGDITLQMVATGIVFMIVPLLTRGRTIGHLILRLRVVRPDGGLAPWYAVVLRYALLFWGFLLLPRWIGVLVPVPATITSYTHEYALAASTLQAVVLVGQLMWFVSVLFRAIASAFGKPFVMLNGVITNTRVLGDTQIDRMRHDTNRPSLEEEEGDGDLGANMTDAFDDRLGGQFDDPEDEK